MNKILKSVLVAMFIIASGNAFAAKLTVNPFSIGPGQVQTIKFYLSEFECDAADMIGFDIVFNLPKGVYPVGVEAPYDDVTLNNVIFNESRTGAVKASEYGLFWRKTNDYNMKLMVETTNWAQGTDGDWLFAIDVYADETVEAGDQTISFYDDETLFMGENDEFPSPEDVAVTVSDKFIVNIPSSGWATLCSTVDLDITGLTVYAVTKAEGGKTEVEKIEGALKAGVGALIKGEAGTVEIPTGSGATEPETNFLVGVTAYTPNPNYGSVYFLKDGKFKKAAKSAALSAGKAYLQVPASSAKDFEELDIVISDPTAIKAVETEQNAGVLYNLNGIRVDNPTKGVYIQNGRKVVVK